MAVAHLFVLLLGAGLVAVPIVLHLLMQPKPKPLVFPGLRFLQLTASSNRRQRRVRQWLLLLLRCLVLLLPALALAGPAVAASAYANWLWVLGIGSLWLLASLVLYVVWASRQRARGLLAAMAAVWLLATGWLGWSVQQALSAGSGQLLGAAEAPVSALILIDNSPRMSYRWENRSSLERAQELAMATVGQLPEESEVCVLETKDDEPFFSVDLASARKRISTFEIGYLNQPIPDVLMRGTKLLAEGKHERREVYLFTDLTKASWTSEQSKELQQRLEELAAGSVFVIDVGAKEVTNLGISAPQLESAVLAAGMPLRLQASLARTGGALERMVELEIEQPDESLPTIRDGKTVVPEKFWKLAQSVQVPENGSANVQFEFSEPLPRGVYHGRMFVQGTDGLQLDNERYFTLNVRDSWKVLVVHPAGVNPLDIVEIIAPGSAEGAPRGNYECTTVEQQQISQVDFSQFGAVILLNPTAFEEAVWRQLGDYVRGGGGLCITLGQNALQEGAPDERFLSEAAQVVLGGELTFPWSRPEGDVFLRPDSLAHPLFQQFRAIESNLNWSAFPVYSHWGLDLPADPETPRQVLVSYSDRQPALIENVLGKGRVLVLTTPLAEPERRSAGRRPWNDLFVGRPLPAWLMTRELVSYLVRLELDTLNLQTGQTASLANNLREYPESYTLFTPKPNQGTTKVAVVGEQLRYRFTDFPGQYRLKGTLDGPVIRGFSVNVHPADTDLTRLAPGELESVLGTSGFQLASDQTQIERQQGTARKGQEFYPLVVLMLLAVFAMEYLLSNRFYRSPAKAG
ncbi:MAG: BatA domain-containing protein [Planctomycetota bacterium]